MGGGGRELVRGESVIYSLVRKRYPARLTPPPPFDDNIFLFSLSHDMSNVDFERAFFAFIFLCFAFVSLF